MTEGQERFARIQAALEELATQDLPTPGLRSTEAEVDAWIVREEARGVLEKWKRGAVVEPFTPEETQLLAPALAAVREIGQEPYKVAAKFREAAALYDEMGLTRRIVFLRAAAAAIDAGEKDAQALATLAADKLDLDPARVVAMLWEADVRLKEAYWILGRMHGHGIRRLGALPYPPPDE